MRRRALLAVSAKTGYLPPESTTFEFPLYLNTKIIDKTPDYLYRSRAGDAITDALYHLYAQSGVSIESFFKEHPVYIDGALVTSAYDDGGAWILYTDKYYGDYSSLDIYFDVAELYVEAFY